MKPEIMLNTADILEELASVVCSSYWTRFFGWDNLSAGYASQARKAGHIIINPPSAIERSVDKYYALTFLESAGLPIQKPLLLKTRRTQWNLFMSLEETLFVKPIFGSRGIGSTRISDADVAERIFLALNFHHQVILSQEFVPHGNSDLRIFVLGNRVLASMRRVAALWKTNVSLGASPKHYETHPWNRRIGVESFRSNRMRGGWSRHSRNKQWAMLIEINSQPGWKGLQTVTSVNIADEIANYAINQAQLTSRFSLTPKKAYNAFQS